MYCMLLKCFSIVHVVGLWKERCVDGLSLPTGVLIPIR